MRVATWNVNGLRARLEFVLQWLKEREPDVVGLQELKLTDEKFPHAEIEAAGYRALSHGQKAWNGVAILSREEAVLTQQGLPGQEAFGARLISARVGNLAFTTVYCPNGKHVGHDDFPKKLTWFDALAGHLASTVAADTASVLCGDFNVCPTALDSWNGDAVPGAIFHTDEERARIAALLDRGYEDAYRAKHPEERVFTWWDYRGGSFHRGHGLRIDFLLATPPAMARVREVWIDRDFRKKRDGLTASDHAPVLADLD
jgi:exodeoxyribonuclease-3